MNESKPNLTRHIGFRVSEAVFERIRMQADQGKSATVWCRDRVIEAAAHHRITPGERVLLDEIVATQEITINLLNALMMEGKVSAERFNQITQEAHAAKHREAGKLLDDLQPKAESNRPTMPNRSERRTGYDDER